MPSLVFEIEDGSQVVAPLEARTTIGRAEGNDIVAEREDIAPHHAELFLGGDGAWWVRDRNSATGTFVNGARVSIHRLSPGDCLFLGSISARFSMDTGATATERRAKPAASPTATELDTARQRRELSEVSGALIHARAQFEKTVKDQEERLRALREQAAKLESAIGSRKQEFSALTSEFANAQVTVERAAKIHESRVAQLQGNASELESEIDKKQQQLTMLAGALRDAEKTITESRRVVVPVREKRKKHGEPVKPGAETAGANESGSQRVETPSEQTRSKLVEMERLEHDLADLAARKTAAASALEQHESARQRAEEALKQTALERGQAEAEFTKLTGEKARLTDEVRWLGVKCGGLTLEVSVLETRKTELQGVVDGLDKCHAEAVKKLAAAAEILDSTTARHDQLMADIEKATARHAELQTKADQVAERIRGAQSELEAHTSARENVIALKKELEAEVATIGNRLAELSGTEERLVRARLDLDKTEAAHSSLTNLLEDLKRKHGAAEQAAGELETHIAALKETRTRFEEGMPALKSSHEAAQAELAAFKSEAEESRRALTDDIERLRADALNEQARLSSLLQEVSQARLRQTELEQVNGELEAATKRLDEAQAGHRTAEMERNKVEAKAQVLRKAYSDTQLRLAELESAEKSAAQRVSRLTSQEAKLQNAVRQLGDEQQRESKRAEELRGLSQSAEQEGARQKEQLATGIAELRAEIARLETRLANARSWNAELDQLYEKLGKIPDTSPEARKVWQEIQRRKTDITEQLPSGIQVRPQSRPTVVPRAR